MVVLVDYMMFVSSIFIYAQLYACIDSVSVLPMNFQCFVRGF